MRAAFGRIGAAVAARPIATLLVVGAFALVGAALALQLRPSASTDTLVGRSSASSQATDRLHRQFGDEAVVILVKGDLQRTVLTSDLGKLVGLEGCLSGNVPAAGLVNLPSECRELARLKPARTVYGPGTFINVAATEIQQGFAAEEAQAQAEGNAAAATAVNIAKQKGLSVRQQQQFAADARQLANQSFLKNTLTLALTYGLTSIPSIDNPQFVSQLVFDTASGHNVPKPRFAFLFPSDNAALIQIRMRPELTDSQRRRAIQLFKEAVAAPNFHLANGQRYIVTGVPVVVDSLASAVQKSTIVLLIAALVLMALTLMVVFRSRSRVRLLPLAIALAAAAITYGCVSLAGLSLTMASIAALPVLIGLSVDYAIQLQARFDEARGQGDRPALAARRAATGGAATISGAALATAAGFLVLLLSPVPMVHGFAFVVILGIALALACALTAGLAALTRFSDPAPVPEDLPPMLPGLRERIARFRLRFERSRVADRLRGTGAATAVVAVCVVLVGVGVATTGLVPRLVVLALLVAAIGLLWLMRDARRELADYVRRLSRRTLAMSVSQPQRILAIGFTIAVLGWVADTQTGVVSDVRQLVPQNLGALRDVNTLESSIGVSGEIDVLVHGQNLTSPAVINWMTSFQASVLARHGYRSGATCLQARNAPELCPALSLTDLFQGQGGAVNVNALLAAVPPYFSQAVISQDRTTANLAFGIRLMPLDRQKQVIDDIRSRLHPPAGVSAEVAGLPVLAADVNQNLSSEWRRLLSLAAGLAAVFCVLLLLRRRLSLAAIPLIPIALATGWSALVLFLLRIPLNPMSVTLGALVIAISTEFSVLLSSRYHEERQGGAGRERALELTYASTGAAVLASAATAIAGFGALMASDIRMLRDFGAVTVVDLTVSLIGVMIVLPAALVWSEQHGRLTVRDFDPRALARAWWGALQPPPPETAVIPGASAPVRAARPGRLGAWSRRLSLRPVPWPRTRRGRSRA